MQDILREESRREAAIADAAAEVRAAADAADAAARAAAIAAVGATADAAADEADAAAYDVDAAASVGDQIASCGVDAAEVPEAAMATSTPVADISEMSAWNGGYLSDDSPLESEVVRGSPLLYV